MKKSKCSIFFRFQNFQNHFSPRKKCFFDSDFFSVLEIISRIDCTQKIHYIRGLNHYILTIYYFVSTASHCQITIFIYAYTPGGGICSFLRKKGVYAAFCICSFSEIFEGVYAAFLRKKESMGLFWGRF